MEPHTASEPHPAEGQQNSPRQRRRLPGWALLFFVVVLGVPAGFAAGFQMGGGDAPTAGGLPSAPGVRLLTAEEAAQAAAAGVANDPVSGVAAATPAAVALIGPALPPAQYVAQLPISYTLPIRYGSLGPQLVAAGAIDLAAFAGLYTDGGKPLNNEQQAILSDGSNAPVVIDKANAHFLLNFFWAVGLANRNPVLLEGPMQKNGPEGVLRFASTGGWTLAARPVAEVYASLPLIELSPSQQQRLQAVAEHVYRPCCGNSTAFPDCNHGMAMLGILELMAANDASEEQMFAAAKYVSAFWFPRDVTEAAAYFKLTQDLDFAAIAPRRLVSQEILSGSGARSVRAWLASRGQLGEPAPDAGDCGV